MCLWHRFETVNVAINEIIHIYFTNSRLATLNAGITAAKLFTDDFLIFKIRQIVSVYEDFRTAAGSCKVDLRVVAVTTYNGLQFRRQLFWFNTERMIFRVLVFEFVFEDIEFYCIKKCTLKILPIKLLMQIIDPSIFSSDSSIIF